MIDLVANQERHDLSRGRGIRRTIKYPPKTLGSLRITRSDRLRGVPVSPPLRAAARRDRASSAIREAASRSCRSTALRRKDANAPLDAAN